MLQQIGLNLRIGAKDAADGFGVQLVPHVGGGGGDQPFDIELVRVEQQPDERFRVVLVRLHIGQDEQTPFGRIIDDMAGGGRNSGCRRGGHRACERGKQRCA